MNDRILEMITQIVKALLRDPNEQTAEEELINGLLEEGYRPEEIVGAFRWLESLSRYLVIDDQNGVESFLNRGKLSMDENEDKKEIDKQTTSREPAAGPRMRILHQVELAKFTSEGRDLFYSWINSGLIEQGEQEHVLNQVLEERNESIDSERLIAIAREASREDSALSLYLMEHPGQLPTFH